MRKIYVVLILLLANISAWAQIQDPIKWSTQAKKTAPNEYDLIFSAKLDKGWHVYSKRVKDETLISPELTFTAGNYQKVGGIKEVGKLIKEVIKVGKEDLELLYYLDKADFIQHVKLTGEIKEIHTSIYYSVCTSETCTPPEEKEFSFAVSYDKNASTAKTTITEKTDKVPVTFTPAPNMLGNGANAEMKSPTRWNYNVKDLGNSEYELHFTADIEKGWHIYGVEKMLGDGPTPTAFEFNKNADIQLVGEIQSLIKSTKIYDSVFKTDVYRIEDKAEFVQKIKLLKPVKNVTGNITFMTCNDQQCIPGDTAFSVQLDKTTAAPLSKDETLEPASNSLLLSVFGQGFAGGLLALLTPCVFPMIPLTVSFFTKKGQHKRSKSISSAALFGLSIIGIYVGLGFLISLIFGFDALNNIASNLYLNFVFFALFFIFALSFLGAFEITLPSSWANKADEKSEKGGIIGIFFMAFTLAIVSFSCTGVIIGSLLVEATKGGYSGPITGMLGFAIALALPFTLFAIFPSWMQSLPKSGGWLNSVKVVLGFLELALAFKFLSTADLVGHYDLFKREYFLVIWIVIFALMGFYLLGKLKFSHDSDVSYVSVPRLILAIMAFAFAIYMVPGLWGAPTRLLSGLAPPKDYTEGGMFGSGAESNNATAIPAEDKPQKYTGLFHAPHGINSFFDYEEALAMAKKKGKPLMIDFTGLACVNCRRMEDNVWVDPKVLEKLKNDYVLVQLYVDDKTKLADNEVYVSDFSGKKINTIGKKWSDLQATRYKANSQPFYVLLDHSENILAQPRGYDPDVNDFAGYLDEGINKFKAQANK